MPQTVDVLRERLGARYPLLQAGRAASSERVWWLLIEPDVRARVCNHLGQSRLEQGGLLLGEVFAESPEPAQPVLAAPRHVVWITEAVASTQYEASTISLRMQSGIWSEAGRRLSGETRVVGWYHSHPDLGVFFSSTDEATQAAFFSHDYSLGWVIDPIRQQEAWFRGRHSLRINPADCFTLQHGEA